MARPRKPTHLKVVAGTAQPCRINPSEPQPTRGRPSPPAHLSDRAKVAWGAVCLILDEMGVLTTADVLAVEGLCEAYAELQAARGAIRDLGSLTYETTNKDGGTMRRAHPEVAMAADADRRFAGWLAKCGMTPADRSRVTAGEREQENPFAALG